MNEQILTNRPTFPAQLDYSHPLTKGLVGCWVLNDPSGIRIWDSSPCQNHLTLSGFTGSVKREFNGLLFNGTTDYGRKAITSWRNSDNVGSVSFWFQTKNTGIQAIFGSADESAALHFVQIGVRDTTGECFINESGVANDGIKGTKVINDGVLHFSTVSSDGSSWKIKVDGTEEPLQAVVGSNSGTWLNDLTATSSITIGALQRNTTTNYASGRIFMVLYHNRQIELSEHKSLYLNPYDMFLK